MLAKLQPLLCSFARGLSTKPWKVTGLNHVAMVVPDVEKAATFYRDTFGVQVDKPFLISPIDEHSPVAKFLERNKSGGLHHICVEVDDLRGAVEGIKKKNLRFLAPEPKVGACGLPVIFMHPKDANGVLIELEASHSTEGH
ncbi:hypothetical protein CRM22_006139 [Opisthorchis felineus]|uniref:VOC domain-containing protein n=1 Tax=Opisthorchis felineus TaxID=147828 RepID=A0A4S2LMD9_OPIFE|nr:hypothetical protein CRM22_006139 [Opisthorchis felineus]